jgi:DNA-directed RNA polymerase subunit L
MQLKVLKKTSQELKLEIEGEGHTLCNLLESVLLEDDNVEFASYHMPHPLISNTIITIRTNKKLKPEDALKTACEKVLQRGRELNDVFTQALEQRQK